MAQSGDRVVGIGYLRGAPPLPGLTLDVDVDPDYRRRGIGTRLLQALDAAAGPHGFATQMAIHERFTGSLAFAARHGFAEHDRSSESALELSAFDPDAYADATQAAQAHGIRFVTMQEVDSPELRHRLYPLANQVSLDMPSPEPMTPMTYEQYLDAWLEAPHSRLDLLVIAVPQIETGQESHPIPIGATPIGLMRLDTR